MNEAFFRRVEHDLRGELATMMAGLHFLLRYEKGLSPTANDMLGRIQGAADRLKRLLDEFGDASWIGWVDEKAPRAIESAPYDVGAVVEGALERVAGAIAARNVTLERKPGTVTGPGVGDGELLKSAIEYALDFGIARSPNGKVTVEWEVVGGGPPVVTIADRGGPVEEEQLERLLAPFVEQEVVAKPPPGTRKRERLGLGLAIANGIVQSHGGSIGIARTSDENGIVLRLTLGPTIQSAKRSA
jgi:two-component system OmpR family sensor kinase